MGYHRRNLLSYRIVYNPKRTVTRLAVKNFLIKKTFPSMQKAAAGQDDHAFPLLQLFCILWFTFQTGSSDASSLLFSSPHFPLPSIHQEDS